MITICSTGGTIVSRMDPYSGGFTSGGIGVMNTDALAAADVEFIELDNIGSPNVTLDDLARWARSVRAIMDRPDCDGVVLAMGTNGVEEASYFFDLVLNLSQPLIVTGAMSAPGQPFADGLENIADSVEAIRQRPDGLRQLGVCVMFGARLHSARYVRKIHANNVPGLDSVAGPVLGEMVAGLTRRLELFTEHLPHSNRGYFESLLDDSQHEWKDVWIVGVGLGASSSILRAAVAQRADGIVVEGFPSGELSDVFSEGLQAVLDKRIPVVVVPRASFGHITPLYAGPGQGTWLQERSVPTTSRLGVAKTRVLLVLALARNTPPESLFDAIS